MKATHRVLLPLGLLFALPESAVAESASSDASVAVRLSPQAQLKTSPARWGAAVHVRKESIDFFSCADTCTRSPSTLSVPLPPEAQGRKHRTQVLQLKDGVSGFLVEVGDATDRRYSVIVLGAARESQETTQSADALPPPRLVLKGWTDASDQQLIVQESSSGARVFLTSGTSEAVCGRTFPDQIKMLDAKSGQFRSTRLPLLPAQERKDATSLTVVEANWSEKDVALRLKASPGDSALALDGDQKQPWLQGHDVVEFLLPEAATPHELLLKFAENDEPKQSQLWLATQHSVYLLEFPALSAGLFAVTLPDQTETQAGSCIALVQDQVPAGLAEVFVRTTVERSVAPSDLIARLENPDASWTEAALGFADAQTIELLAEKFPRLNALARERAIAVAQSLPHGLGIPVFVAAFEFGNEKQAELALAEFNLHSSAAVSSLAARLHFASSERLHDLALTMVALDVERAVPLLLEEIKRERPAERRLSLRDALAEAARSDLGRTALRPHVEQKVKWPRHVRLELARALRPSLHDWQSAGVRLLEGLADGASFREAYLLAPLASDMLEKSPDLRRHFGAWLSGKLPQELKAAQRAALQVRLLETLNEREGTLTENYRSTSVSLLQSENVRVRASALTWLAHFPAPDLIDPSEDLLEDDPWPRVRGAAALVLGHVAAEVPTARREVIDDLGDGLKSDDDPAVRRALVRALAEVNDLDSKKSLRRALAKDEDFKVRAEAARALGQLCDLESTETLTDLAHELARAPAGDGPVTLSLAALGALIDLNPPDLDARIAPLLTEQVPGILRARIRGKLSDKKTTPGCGSASR